VKHFPDFCISYREEQFRRKEVEAMLDFLLYLLLTASHLNDDPHGGFD